jgi:predicted metal-dependent peptidase
MASKDVHPKIKYSTEMMVINRQVGLPFYGQFMTYLNMYERKNDPRIKTAGVNVSTKGMNYYYNPDFIDSLTQEQTNFLNIHEIMHLLFNHPKRTRMGGYDPELSNIAQDMIINTIIMENIKASFVDIPKDEKGRNTALFIPKEYIKEKGKDAPEVFEPLYNFLKEYKDTYLRRKEKKEEERIFAELFAEANRPFLTEYSAGAVGAYELFIDTLTPESQLEARNYMRNFIKRVVVNVANGLPVSLVAHTSSVIPAGEGADYNQELSQRRGDLFKEAVMEMIDDYCDVMVLSNTIIADEVDKVSEADKVKFILTYEDITSKALKAQRETELRRAPADAVGDPISMVYQTYRMTQLMRMEVADLTALINSLGLTVPNIATEKVELLTKAKAGVQVVAKADSEPIIINELDSELSVLRSDIANLPQYASYRNIKDPAVKQQINRRLEYIFDSSNDKTMGGGSGSSSENSDNRDGYGENGSKGEACFDLDTIMDNMGDNNGQFMDVHIGDDIPDDMREEIVNRVTEKLKARGFVSDSVAATLEKLQRKRKDYLKEIKRGITMIKGTEKSRTITRPNRKGIMGVKGNKKFGSKINVILDTSSSMTGYWEKALSYVFRSDIQINLIQIDTEIKSVENIKSMNDLKKVVVTGGGGTTMKLAFDLIKDKYNNLNNLLLTDGMTESLDLSGLKGRMLIISNTQECPISESNGKLRQIVVDEND